MSQSDIPKNATIEDVLPTLSEPEEYVRAIVSTMSPCVQKYSNARVRIGVTGEGKMPYHKITFTAGDGNEHFYGAYAGESPFHGVKIHEGSTWSSAFMTHDDVRALLGKLRGWKGKKL